MQLTRTTQFIKWLNGIKDPIGKAAIIERLNKLALFDYFGDAKPVGDGVTELKINTGPGYRVYLKKTGKTVVLLILGGTKRLQSKDIAKAKKLAAQYEEQNL